MALLIYGLDNDEVGSAAGWRAAATELLPGMEVRIFPETGNVAEIDYLAFMHPDFDAMPALPKL